MVRLATAEDLDRLVELETVSFEHDRISRASFRRLLRRPSALLLVDEEPAGGAIRGAAVLLFRRGLAVARLYSLAVLPTFRGQGVGAALVEAAQSHALERGCVILRLEVREENASAVALYERLGFQRRGRIEDYYADGAAALRFDRTTVRRSVPVQHLDVPYYAQTLDFTCGAACLLMSCRTFVADLPMTRARELDLWRRATTIFMTSGIGGCSAEGIAAAALDFGLVATVVTTVTDVPFIQSVRSERKKEVLRIVHAAFLERLHESGRDVLTCTFRKEDIQRAVDLGIVPVLLVSGFRLHGERTPHWVVVTGYDDRFIYIHDPYIPTEVPEFDGRHLPIHEQDFMQIHRFGRAGSQSMVLIHRDKAVVEEWSRSTPSLAGGAS